MKNTLCDSYTEIKIHRLDIEEDEMNDLKTLPQKLPKMKMRKKLGRQLKGHQ